MENVSEALLKELIESVLEGLDVIGWPTSGEALAAIL